MVMLYFHQQWTQKTRKQHGCRSISRLETLLLMQSVYPPTVCQQVTPDLRGFKIYNMWTHCVGVKEYTHHALYNLNY